MVIKLNILILSDYFSNYCENRASFEIRKKTAINLAKDGDRVVFAYPGSFMKLTITKSPDSKLIEISTPGFLPMKFRNGGFGFIDCIVKSLIVLICNIDAIQVTNGHRPSQLIPCIIGKYFRRCKLVNECWEWLGPGGYADKRNGVIGKFVAYYDTLLELPVEKLFDKTIVISDALKNRFRNKDNVIVLHGGADNTSLFPYDIKKARDLLGIDQDLILIGMSNVIRGDHDDNIIFLKCFKILVEEHPNIKLICTSTEPAYITEICDLFNIRENVVSPGYLGFEEYNIYLSSCNIFVLPFTNTNINTGRWPNKIGDFISLRRPVITNPNGDIEKLFRQYQLGILCEANPIGFYESIKMLIQQDKYEELFSKDSSFVSENILSLEKRITNISKLIKMTNK